MTAHLREAWHQRIVAGYQREGDERSHGDYTLRYHQEDQGERKPRHVITAYEPGGNKVGEMNWYGTTGTIHHVEVEQEHGRRGIATAMWQWGQEMRPRPKHSGDRTEMGEQWAKSVGGPRPKRARSSLTASLKGQIDGLRSEIARVVQPIIDAWEQDEEGVDEVYGSGGVCDDVASKIHELLGEHGIDTYDGGAAGDDHAWVVAIAGDEVVGVDIPPGVYESGGGYSWRKIPDVHLSPHDVAVWDLDVPAAEFTEGQDW